MYGCSGGTVGFKSAARGGYEAAYQAALNMFQTIKERHRTDWPNRKHGGIMTRLEIILQGTGPGKDAFRRAIMTDEGATIRYFVSRISDGTKIQIGGVRPKKRRSECSFAALIRDCVDRDDADASELLLTNARRRLLSYSECLFSVHLCAITRVYYNDPCSP